MVPCEADSQYEADNGRLSNSHTQQLMPSVRSRVPGQFPRSESNWIRPVSQSLSLGI